MAWGMTDSPFSAPSHPQFMGEMTGTGSHMFSPDRGPVIPPLPKGIV